MAKAAGRNERYLTSAQGEALRDDPININGCEGDYHVESDNQKSRENSYFSN